MTETDMTMSDFSDCITTGPMMGEVGHLGDIDELREYPYNCEYCRAAGDLEEALDQERLGR